MAINPLAIFSGFSGLANLLSSLLAVDIVGIYDNTTLKQVFSDARPLKAEVKESSIVMRHPVETGTMIADNHIINQVEINISVMIKSENYNSVYGQIKQAFVAGTSLSIQTRTGVYPNMIIADMPHTESADYYDAIVMNLHFIEVIYVVPISVSDAPTPANFSPESPVNSNTVQAGLKYPVLLSVGGAFLAQSALRRKI